VSVLMMLVVHVMVVVLERLVGVRVSMKEQPREIVLQPTGVAGAIRSSGADEDAMALHEGRILRRAAGIQRRPFRTVPGGHAAPLRVRSATWNATTSS
jgi:hypothetical protein